MSDFTRRDVIKTTIGAAAVGAGGSLLLPRNAMAQQAPNLPIEKGATLRLLRWSQFVQGDIDTWMANTKKFTEKTGVEVRIDREAWPDIAPKASVAANVGSGPDIILDFFDVPHLFADKLVDLTDIATYIGNKYGGWFPVCERYAKRGNQWIALPLGAAGACMVYRKSHVEAAGFSEFPKDTDGFLKLCKALHAKGTPAGFALGNAVGDGSWTYWLIWAFGGKIVDDNNKVVINSPETIKALEYAKELYPTFAPGTLGWLDPNNNKAFLDGQISLTNNGISVYYAAKNSQDPKIKALADDINHANFPIGPVGRPTELHLFSQAYVFKYSKFPNAAKAYLQFMWEKEQYEPWQEASIGYITHPLKDYEKNKVWSTDPKNLPYRDTVKNMLWHGYSGQLGSSSAAALNDYIVNNMVAQAASGSKTPKEAAEEAEKRLQRLYRA